MVSDSGATAAASSSTVVAAVIALRRWKGVRVSTAIRSVSEMTPITRPDASTTGRWRTPRSSMSSSASAPVTSSAMVVAGAVITCDTGVSAGTPAATTRSRRSRSVTMPNPSPRSTSTDDELASTMRRAASCTVAAGAAITGSPRSRRLTGRRAGSTTAIASGSRSRCSIS